MSKYNKDNPVYSSLKFFSSFLHDSKKDTRKLLLYLLIGIMIVVTFHKFQKVFITLLLIILGSTSMLYIRFAKISHYIGFELCTLATVLTGITYGPHYGAVTGAVSIFFGFVLSGHFKPSYFISVLILPIIGIISPLFSFPELWQLGVLMTIIYDIIILPLYILMGSRVTSTIIFFITHVLLNFWLFQNIAPIIVGLMT